MSYSPTPVEYFRRFAVTPYMKAQLLVAYIGLRQTNLDYVQNFRIYFRDLFFLLGVLPKYGRDHRYEM